MFQKKSICIVIPCYNEESQVEKVITSLPIYIDKIIAINDCSTDKTFCVLENLSNVDNRLVVLNHDFNLGVGASIANGYKWARDNNFDIAVVMAGDGQMKVDDLENIILPVCKGEADYTKGNRLISGKAFKNMPKIRFFGNAILSLLTKIASGYWHISDSQNGYTAINKKVLHTINWDLLYKKYGQPNDLLVKLNVHNFRVQDVVHDPVYNVGEKSNIIISKVTFTIALLLVKCFFFRIKEKYIIRDFHPLVFFYFIGFIFFLLTLLLGLRLSIIYYLYSFIPKVNALAMMFSFMSSSLFLLFAMIFDKLENDKLVT